MNADPEELRKHPFLKEIPKATGGDASGCHPDNVEATCA
jgi:hypothetical protein